MSTRAAAAATDSDALKERIREATDIVAVIGEHVKLRRSGSDYRGPCPFHNGTGPNFSVSPKRQSYHCFVCDESGDVFSFLQKHLGMSFPDALRAAGERSGIEVPRFEPKRTGPDPREALWEVNATAAEYLRSVLWNEAAGEPAREYLRSRYLRRETAERFGLGFAPADAAALRAHMAALGFDDERLLSVGLLVKPEGAAEPRVRFRNRLMFPILDASGRHVAFGGRAIGDATPKYLNSPETPVFAKRSVLYGLSWAKNDIRREDRALVVEGYFDVIRLADAGVATVVAPLGTALTDAHGAMLAKYTKNVFLLYDADKAGLRATFRAGDELLRQGVAARVVSLPGGEDPDTFVASHGRAALELQIAGSVDVFERKVQILERGGWFDELQKKRQALDRLLPTIRAAADPLLREIYVARAAEKAGVTRELLLREVGVATSAAAENVAAPVPREVPRRRAASSDRRSAYNHDGASAERALVLAMLHDRSTVDRIAERIGADKFRDARYRRIFTVLLEIGGGAGVETITESLTPDEVAVVDALLAVPEEQAEHPLRTIEDSLLALWSREVYERLAEIDRLFTLATDEQKDALMREKQALVAEISATNRRRFKKFRYSRHHSNDRNDAT